MHSRTHKQATETIAGGLAVLAVAGSLLAVHGHALASETTESTRAGVSASQRPPAHRVEPARPAYRPAYRPDPAVPTGIQVFFKLDPRLTRSLYMGDRWVSPATYTSTHAQGGTSITVEARAQVVDARGRPMRLSPTWTPADPDLMAVSPREGNQVTITVRRAGQSTLVVRHGAVSKELTVKTVQQAGTWRVDISQLAREGEATAAATNPAPETSGK